MATWDGNSLEQYSEETFDFLCSVCKQRENKISDAQKYCLDCQDYFCVTCVKNIHNYVPALSSHNIVDKGQNSSGSGSVFPAVPTEKCGRHSQQPIAMYCQNHGELGCSTCVISEHRICQDIAYIPDFVRNNPQAIGSKDIEIKLDSLMKSLQEIENSVIQEKAHLLRSKAEEIKKIQEFREEINKRLDVLERTSLDNLEKRFQVVKEKIEDAMKDIRDLTVCVKSAQDNLKFAGGNVSQLFVSIKQAKKVASTAEQEMNSIDTEFNTASINFAPEQMLLTMINEMTDLEQGTVLKPEKKEVGINTENIHLGQDLLKSEKKETGTNTDIIQPPFLNEELVLDGQSSRQKMPNQEDNTMMDRSKKKRVRYKISITGPDDGVISSICKLADGTILFTDKEKLKFKLNRLHGYTLAEQDYCDLPVFMNQVCAISNSEAAVGGLNEIQLVSIGSTLTLTKKIPICFQCTSLTLINGILYYSDDKKSINEHSLAGDNITKSLTDQTGQGLFSEIKFMAASNDGSRIYVVDKKKGLIILDRNGQLIKLNKDLRMTISYSLCLYKNNIIVLISKYKSCSVLEFSSEGELIQTLIELDTPGDTICCTQDNSRLLISYKNKIHVIDL